MEGHPLFARVYDRMMARGERNGLEDMRRELLSAAAGNTLEVGAGTGANLPHYTDAVSALTLTEPDPHMATRLRERLARERPRPGRVEVVEASADALPFDDGSFDTVVCTLVLCTVPDPKHAVEEIRRVLSDGGALLFVEHVRAEGRGAARAQDLIQRPWGLLIGGCHPNRATGARLAEAGFWIERMRRGPLPGAPRRLFPMITGVARRPSAVGDPDY